MGAEGAEAADLDLAGLAHRAPAVPAGPDGLGVVVLVTVGHAGEIVATLHSVNVPAEISGVCR